MAINYTHQAAIRQLQKQQKSALVNAGFDRSFCDDTLAKALQWVDTRESYSVLDGDEIHDGLYQYPAELERLRWQRTRDILHRVSPGNSEDPHYIEILARQAASIEVILRQEHTGSPHQKISQMCNKVLLATIPTLNPSAFSSRYKGFYFVFISAGLIDYLYQISKAVVLSWRQLHRPGASASFSGLPEDIDYVLGKNSYALDMLREVTDAYMFLGVPRAPDFASPVPNDHLFPLQLLTNFNERFVIAHEYGHSLFGQADIAVADTHDEEHSADAFAFDYVAQSAWVLDRVPPNFSLQGVFFVLTTLQIIRKTLDLLRYGEIRTDKGFLSHPPVSQRFEYARHLYLTKISNQDDKYSIRPALQPAYALRYLWNKLQGHFVEQWRKGRKLHPIWKDI